jgi:hypothetical protein
MVWFTALKQSKTGSGHMWSQHHHRHRDVDPSRNPEAEGPIEWNWTTRWACILSHFNNFFYFQLMYLSLVSIIGGIILAVMESCIQKPQCTFMNTWFMAVSSMTGGGLNSIDPSNMTFGGQVVILILMFLGNAVALSLIPTFIRRAYVHDAALFKVTEDERAAGNHNANTKALEAKAAVFLEGQVEYKALTYYMRITVLYWFLVQLGSCLCLGFYFMAHDAPRQFLASRGVDPWWFALFGSVSAFSNVGYLPLTDNIYGLNTDICVCLTITGCQVMKTTGPSRGGVLRGKRTLRVTFQRPSVVYRTEGRH